MHLHNTASYLAIAPLSPQRSYTQCHVLPMMAKVSRGSQLTHTFTTKVCCSATIMKVSVHDGNDGGVPFS